MHKERNLLAHAPKELHDEVKADYTDMMYAENAADVRDGSRMMVRFLGSFSLSVLCHPARSMRTTACALAATFRLISSSPT